MLSSTLWMTVLSFSERMHNQYFRQLMNMFLENNNINLRINTDVEQVCGRPSLSPERVLDSLEI